MPSPRESLTSVHSLFTMHRRALFHLSLALLASFAAWPSSAAVSHGFRVPDGFEVSLYAGDDLAHDIFSMTTDAKGRIVRSEEHTSELQSH